MNTPLKKVRKKHSKTLQQVAIAVDIDVGNLSRIERGLQTPSPDLAEKIALFFNREITETEIFYPQRFCEAQKEGSAHVI